MLLHPMAQEVLIMVLLLRGHILAACCCPSPSRAVWRPPPSAAIESPGDGSRVGQAAAWGGRRENASPPAVTAWKE